MLSWIVFAVGFLLRKKHTSQKEKKKDKLAMLGIALEGAGFAIVFSVRRAAYTDLVSMNMTAEIILTTFIFFIAIGSVWLALAAIRKLGKQWDVNARIIEEHELITTGPYRIVRHPIYTGMFGLLIITGYSMTHLWVYLLAIVLFIVGTVLRIRVEERLLIQHFGEKYKNYKLQVPALIPFHFWKITLKE